MGRILHAVKEISSFLAVALIFVILLTNGIVMIYTLFYLPHFIGGAYFGVPIYILVPVPLLLGALMGMHAYAWYVLLVCVILAALVSFMWVGMQKYVTKLLKDPLSYKSTPVQEFAEIFSLTLFLSVAIVILMKMGGVHTHGIGLEKTPFYSQILNLLHASVYEELVTRVVFLGIPVYLIRKVLFAWGRSEYNVRLINIFGGVKKIGSVEIVFIILSALIFGVAHTPAWGWWKLVPAFVAGLGMGYLFIKYGIQYSILFHFATDFTYVSMSMSSFTTAALGIIYTLMIILGIVFLISYTIRVFRYFHPIKHRNERREPIPWIDVRCPNCGSQHFIYMDGKLKCVDCGTIFEYEYPGQSHQSGDEDHRSTLPP